METFVFVEYQLVAHIRSRTHIRNFFSTLDWSVSLVHVHSPIKKLSKLHCQYPQETNQTSCILNWNYRLGRDFHAAQLPRIAPLQGG